MKKNLHFNILASALFGTLISTTTFAHETANITYGTVKSVNVTTPDSKIAQSAIIGGVIGLAIGHDVKGALDGGAAGFAIMSAMEGDRRVYLYTLNVNKQSKTVLIETGGLSEGECAAIETSGNHINLRSVSHSFCSNSGHKALSSKEVIAQQKSQAKACDVARREVLTAKSDNDIDHSLVKVRALCE